MFLFELPGPGRYQVRVVPAEYAVTVSETFTVDSARSVVELVIYLGIQGYALAPLEESLPNMYTERPSRATVVPMVTMMKPKKIM